MEKMKISFTLNGKPCQVEVKPHQRLLDMLRDDLRLTGTKEGCGIGECGACTVIMDGKAVTACLVPAPAVSPSRAWAATGSWIRCRRQFLRTMRSSADSVHRDSS